jgi:hypothetical protein
MNLDTRMSVCAFFDNAQETLVRTSTNSAGLADESVATHLTWWRHGLSTGLLSTWTL